MCNPIVKCVLLADRHHGLSDGIRGLLETAFDAVLMVADANSLFEGAGRIQPALVVLDLSLSGNDGFKLLHNLQVRCPGVKMVALGQHEDVSIARAVLAAGAHGYVLISAIGTDLLPAVETVLAGNTYVSPAVSPDQAPEGSP